MLLIRPSKIETYMDPENGLHVFCYTKFIESGYTDICSCPGMVVKNYHRKTNVQTICI